MRRQSRKCFWEINIHVVSCKNQELFGKLFGLLRPQPPPPPPTISHIVGKHFLVGCVDEMTDSSKSCTLKITNCKWANTQNDVQCPHPTFALLIQLTM